jgi:Tfp pilus assembly protein PilV
MARRGAGWARTSAANLRSAPRGFNLVEALVATMILSGAVLTLSAIGTNALSSTRLHRHYETAASLIDRQLNLIDYLGIDAFLEAGQTDGLIEEFDPGYQWSVTTEYQGTDDLYLVSITMTWLEGKRPYSVTAQTMLDGTGTSLGTSTGTEAGGGPPTP